MLVKLNTAYKVIWKNQPKEYYVNIQLTNNTRICAASSLSPIQNNIHMYNVSNMTHSNVKELIEIGPCSSYEEFVENYPEWLI